MKRLQIDWANLEPLPRKHSNGATREDLAARKFNVAKAKHGGRNHLQNWKRRKMTRQDAVAKKKTAEFFQGKRRSLLDAVRAYWRGENEEHP